ncbi:hypothetical protein K7G98_27490 [Saccharothrix sp. MB29]|nr:hypothetical protein [Saccharothrix sp. MB29]
MRSLLATVLVLATLPAAARAAAAGVRYVDARAHFAGHGACGRSPWINSFSLLRRVESFHPNAAGYAQGYLPLLDSAVG